MSDYQHTPAPKRIDGVNEGIKLLQRRVYQYNGFSTGQGAVETQNSVQATKRYMANGGTSKQTLNKFFQMLFTPSSNHTCIMVKMQMHLYGGSTNLSYQGLSITPLNNEGSNANYIPEHQWMMGSSNSNQTWGYPPMTPSFWYNSWGKDITAKVEWRMNGHSGYTQYTRSPSYVDNAMMSAPNMVIEEWENGNPNGPTVQYVTHGEISDSTGNANGRIHPAENETGIGYQFKEDGYIDEFDPYKHDADNTDTNPTGRGENSEPEMPE
jgi:hypothetical protein